MEPQDDLELEQARAKLAAMQATYTQALEARTNLDKLRAMQREAKRDPDSDRGREASEIARRMLATLEWRDTALVALILEQVCECGARPHFWFEGEYVERKHIRDASARWQLLKGPSDHYPDLPRKIEYQTHRVKLCPSCLKEKGYV